VEKLSKKVLKEQYKNRAMIGGIYCIKCNDNNAIWFRATTDMKGSKNRFAFSVAINSCPETCMIEEWNMHGASTFCFEILEQLQKKETQTEQEFSDDVNILLELWNEKLKG